MTIVLISFVIFALTLGAGLVGLVVHRRLPAEQATDSARSVVGQVAGLVTLLLALVLGTLVGTSFAFFSTQKVELEALSAQVLQLDQALAAFGPETKPLRDKLKQSAEISYNTFWGPGDPDPKLLSVSVPLAAGQATRAFLATLTPTTDAQKQALAAAGAQANALQQSRVMISLQVASNPVSAGLVTVMLIWAVLLFFAMGIFAKSNKVVIAALTFGALCVAFAMFLILELGLPYTGMFRVNPAALEQAIANIDQ